MSLNHRSSPPRRAVFLLAAGTDAFEVDGVAANGVAGQLLYVIFLKVEDLAVEIADGATDLADDVVMVRPLGPFVEAAPLPPVNTQQTPLCLQPGDDPEDRRVRDRWPGQSDVAINVGQGKRTRMSLEYLGDGFSGLR